MAFSKGWCVLKEIFNIPLGLSPWRNRLLKYNPRAGKRRDSWTIAHCSLVKGWSGSKNRIFKEIWTSLLLQAFDMWLLISMKHIFLMPFCKVLISRRYLLRKVLCRYAGLYKVIGILQYLSNLLEKRWQSGKYLRVFEFLSIKSTDPVHFGTSRISPRKYKYLINSGLMLWRGSSVWDKTAEMIFDKLFTSWRMTRQDFILAISYGACFFGSFSSGWKSWSPEAKNDSLQAHVHVIQMCVYWLKLSLGIDC